MKKLFVCFLAVAMVFAFTAPLMAADWNFYGNTRFQTFIEDDDSDKTGTGESDSDTVWYMQGNSRLGGKVAAGDVSGHFEFAVTGQTGGTNVGTRHLTGTWNFGSGTLLVGHTWSVITNLLSNQAANAGQGLLGYGSVYQGRSDQIRLTFGGLKIGFLGPRTSAGAGPDIDVTLPKIEVAYRFATDMFWVEPYLGYQTFERQYAAATTGMSDVTSMIYGLKGKVNFGPAYVGLGITAGTNPTEYGLSGTGQTAVLVGTEYKDVTYMEYMINAGFKINDMMTIEGGYGSQATEEDSSGSKIEENQFSYYIQLDWEMAPGVHLIPEYSVIDSGEVKTATTTTDNGSTSYIGAKWQINF